MRMKKIKSLREQVILEWQTPAKEGKFNNHSLESSDEPRPEFKKALAALKPHLIAMCEIEALDKKLIRVSGVSLSYKGEHDTMNAILTGMKSHKNSNGQLNLNTPLKPSENMTGEDTAAENLLPETCVKLIKNLIGEAVIYINGDRSQTELKLEETG